MFAQTFALLSYGFVQQALIAAALLGLLSGFLTPLIVLRSMSFSVHATSELALMGGAGALLIGVSVSLGAVIGAVAAAVLITLLSFRGRQDALIGVVMSFGLGLGVLFIYLYPGNSSTALSLLTGQIVGVSAASTAMLAVTTVIVIAAVVLLWRPLLFASADPVQARAANVPVATLSLVFAVLVGAAAAQAVQVVGALLVMALLITPGAAAAHVARSPIGAVIVSVIIAEVSAVGGLVLSLAPGLPVSVFVTTISFLCYLLCRVFGTVTGGMNGVTGTAGGAEKSAASGR